MQSSVPTTLKMKTDATGKLDVVVQPSGAGRGTLAVDRTLGTSMLIALCSDRRAATDDILPTDLPLLPGQSQGILTRRGWIGDILLEDGVRLGSRGWLLSRGKMSDVDRLHAASYAAEATTSIASFWNVEIGISAAFAGTGGIVVTCSVGEVSVTRQVGTA